MDGDGLVALVRERRGEMSIMGMVMVCGLWEVQFDSLQWSISSKVVVLTVSCSDV